MKSLDMEARTKYIGVLACLILVGFAFYLLVSYNYNYIEVSGSPIELQAIQGKHIYVPIGEPVEIYLKLYSPSGAAGTLTVYVKKDFVLAPDIVLTQFDRYISLNAGETLELNVGQFIPYDLSGSGGFREYFIQVYFNGQPIYDPKNPEERLWVRTYER